LPVYRVQRTGAALVVRLGMHCRLVAIAAALALSLIGPLTLAPRAAYAAGAYCVNVLLRDPYGGQYRRIVPSGGAAANIGNAFARSGFAVDGAPDVGAIMVWPSGYGGAAGAGHVGIVAAVNGNGTVVVRHENWPYGTAEHLQIFAVLPGHRFVHRSVPVVPVVQTAPAAQPTLAVAPAEPAETTDAAELTDEAATVADESTA
jgi:hypothetical protein